MSEQIVTLNHQHLLLLPQKAIYWKEADTLIVSDVHLGKASHFREHGMAIPVESGIEDIRMLDELLVQYKPVRLLILGDLFHSDYNQEWRLFIALRKKHEAVRFELVMGNHDILKDRHYESCNMEIYKEPLYESGSVFSHDSLKDQKGHFCISGHIHPGFKMYGKGRQSIELPCFYKEQHTMIMPAFGRLTGLAFMPKKDGAEIFVVAGDKVYKV